MDSERVLIVEDERIIALDLRRRLEKLGYQVTGIASTADEAVQRAVEHKPDIILMDIMLSGDEDGIDAARTIRDTSGIPVIFLTAYADERTLERAKAAEPFGYVLKPFKERELYTTIDMALHKSRLHMEVERHERWLAAILNGVADGIIASDKDDTIQFMNPIAENLTGWTEQEARGLPLADVFQIFDLNSGLRVQLPGIGGGPQTEGTFFFDDAYLHNKQGARIRVDGTVASIQHRENRFGGRTIAFRDVTDVKKMSDIIVYQASHDILTGLINRDEFFARLEETARSTNEEGRLHTFLYVDLDQFKVVNDVCGHLAGDELLRQVGAVLVEGVPQEHYVGRLGGDEYGVVLVNTALETAVKTAEKLLQELNRKFIWHKNTFHVSASIGVVPVSEQTSDIYTLLAAADDACYLAKEEGGNAIKVYETAGYSFLKRRGEMQWISRLTHALEENRFVLYAQPVIPLAEGRSSKLEILIRLRETDGTLVSPGDFIPAAERYNLMPAIDRWVVKAVVRYLRKQREQSHLREQGVDSSTDDAPSMLCINLSGASVKDQAFLEFLVELFRDSDIDPAIFCFEVTETTAIESLSHAVGFMNRLRKMGVSFALDDFGNGFTSFAYLKSLPVDYLKIDGSFVRDIDVDPISMAMVEAINNIGHVLGMSTIAEFVSSPSIRQRLADIGVDYVQGFEIARPCPLEDAPLLAAPT